MHSEKQTIFKHTLNALQPRRVSILQILAYLCLISLLLSACTMSVVKLPLPPTEAEASSTVEASPIVAATATVTLIPTVAPISTRTSIPSDPVGAIALDFIALLCNADWMNGAHHLTPCLAANADHSGGYATIFTSPLEGFPSNTPVLLMVPNANALFLRYPSFKVNAGDRFRTTLLCATSASCDVEFALEYYDGQGKYHEFLQWGYRTGDPPIEIDGDLSALAGQNIDFVLTLRLYHEIESPQHDNGLWVAPHIYRASP